jgi:hypothetical protein
VTAEEGLNKNEKKKILVQKHQQILFWKIASEVTKSMLQALCLKRL